MSPTTVKTRVKRCPVCKQPARLFIEHTEVYTEFSSPRPGERTWEGYHSDGYPTHVSARCENEHHWRLRGVKQITDIDLKEP